VLDLIEYLSFSWTSWILAGVSIILACLCVLTLVAARRMSNDDDLEF
jgi:hypothetical protein